MSDQSRDFWCDLTKCNARPLGWCIKEGKQLSPPESVANLIDDVQSHVEDVLKNAKPVPAQLLSGVSVIFYHAKLSALQPEFQATIVFKHLQDGFVPADRIKPGMKVEIQDSVNPYNLWIASVSMVLSPKCFCFPLSFKVLKRNN